MDVVVYDKHYRHDPTQSRTLCWHSNHRVFGDLLPGDRLWGITSGKSLGRDDASAGYLVAVWPVTQVMPNPGDDPDYPTQKYQHRVLVHEVEAMHVDQPVCVDHVIRAEGADKQVSVGRFLRGLRRLSDEKIRQLRSAAGPHLAHKWLTGNKSTTDNVSTPSTLKDNLALSLPGQLWSISGIRLPLRRVRLGRHTKTSPSLPL